MLEREGTDESSEKAEMKDIMRKAKGEISVRVKIADFLQCLGFGLNYKTDWLIIFHVGPVQKISSSTRTKCRWH